MSASGIGRLLLQELIDACAAAGFRQIIGYIDADNAASLALHEKFGFARVGLLPGVAYRLRPLGRHRHGAALARRRAAPRRPDGKISGNQHVAFPFTPFISATVSTRSAMRARSSRPCRSLFRHGQNGVAVLFRYGVAVLIGLSAEEEAAFLQKIAPRVVGKLGVAEEENAFVEIAEGAEDQISAGGPVVLGDMSLPRMLIVADALAKSVALASDERDVTKVFGVIDPFAAELAAHGRTRRNRTEILKLIGNALLVQHRVSGRVAVAEKPDALWDRPDLERLYARLEDEYELKERVETLDRKLNVIADTAETLADIIDTRRRSASKSSSCC